MSITCDATYEFLLSGSNERDSFDGCVYQFGCTVEGNLVQPLAAINRVGVPGANVGSDVHLSASCEGVQGVECPAGHGDINGYAAVVDLFAADVVLEQNQGPAAKEVSGPLATEKPVAGTSDLVFSASDPGAGIWEATFSVDGKVVQSTVPNENGGRCRNVGQSTDGLPGFLYLQPCPQTGSGQGSPRSAPAGKAGFTAATVSTRSSAPAITNSEFSPKPKRGIRLRRGGRGWCGCGCIEQLRFQAAEMQPDSS